ncbi:MAG: hypothetical protein H8E37_09710 [Planctomycetes bacterium]|nr:hypothetical protein [Planctomycetota bacterium]
MSRDGTELRIGFLTAVQTRDRAFVGGLLVTDRFGRPLEFQCTTPVKPNRTQELLYGPTLEPFILGDLLGKALLGRIGVKPTLVVTDREEMLPLRNMVSVPVVSLLGERTSSPNEHEAPQALSVTIGQHIFRTHEEFVSDGTRVATLTKKLATDANLQEPIERVAEALKETMATVSAKPRVA